MKVLIDADMEGACGVNDPRQTNRMKSNPHYEKGRHHMTEDVNAAIRGLKMGGATEIDVVDGHGSGDPPNLICDKIESRAKVLGGVEVWLEMIRSKKFAAYDACVLVAQHSMAGTLDGFIPHTNTGSTALRMNGKYVGEIEENAWLYGHFNVPTILVTGDVAAVREAKAFLLGIECVAVKTATARDKAECLKPDKARIYIQEAAANALKNLKKFKPFKISTPIQVDAVFAVSEQAKIASIMPKSKRTDNRTISYTAEDYPEALFAYFTAIGLGGAYWQNLLNEELQKLKGAKKIMQDFYKKRRQQWLKEPSLFPSAKY